MSNNTIQFTVLGDVKDIESKLAEVKGAFNSLSTVAVLAFAGLTASAFGFVQAAQQEELAVNELNQALKNRGNYTEEASKDLVDYAGSLSEVSLFSKTVIIDSERMIASFGFTGQTLKDLTKAAADFAQGRGLDIVSAATLISKAVSSSTNILKRYGIEIEGAAGSTQRAQSAVEGITKVFGGQAEAATQGLGAITVLKNEMQELSEQIGLALAPNIISTTKLLKGLIDTAKQSPEVAKLAAQFLVLTIQVSAATLAIGLFGKAWISTVGTMAFLNSTLILVGNNIFTLATALKVVGGLGLAAFVGWKVGELTGQITGLNTALSGTQGILTKLFEGNRIQKIQQETAASLAAHNQTMKQIQQEAAARLTTLKADIAAQNAHDQQIMASQKNVDAFFTSSAKELVQIAATSNRQELNDLKVKFEKERQAQIQALQLKESILKENGLLTVQQTKEIDEQIAEINAKYDGLAYQAQKVLQTKINSLQQQGLDTYKKVQSDQLGSLVDTLQTAAGLNKEFAIAYQVLAIGKAIVNTALGVTSALSDGDFISAAIIAALGAVQIATIASQSFEVGTGRVPYDMNARIHKDEIIIPPNFSDAIRRGDLALSGGNEENGNSNSGGSPGIYNDLRGTIINGVTLDLVKQIFTKASEGIKSRIITPLPV